MFAEVAVNAPLRAGDRTFTFSVPASLAPRISIGTPVRVPFGKRTTSGVVVKFADSTARRVKAITSIDDRVPSLPADLVDLAWWISDHYVCSVGEAIGAMLPPGNAPAASGRRSTGAAPVTVAQSSSDGTGIAGILEAARQARVAAVGGDARFEAYQDALAWALRRGHGAIVLVPEVVQAERMAGWLERHLGHPVGLFHGELPPKERWEVWRSAQDGGLSVVVGTRLAVFTPVRDLGLIIIDHEEDASYKEERLPRYHARTVAEVRARSTGSSVVWGTTTPSMEVARAIEEGRAARLVLPPPPRPSIAVADVRAEAGAMGGLFSRRLYQALARVLPKGRAILFVPRRGYADFLLCHECGSVPRCPRCGVALTYHVSDRVPRASTEGRERPSAGSEAGLRCHLCGMTQPAPSTCPVCGGTRVRPHGIGTERVEAAARRLFKGTTVARLDTDAAPDETAQQKVWQQFARRSGLLIGTQLLVKGVGQVPAAVVGAVGVDAELNLPDFRSAERTYQVLSRLAGLAEREMIVQTFSPSHPVMVALAKHQEGKFYRDELSARRQFGYPPYVTLLNLMLTGSDHGAVRDAAERLATVLNDAAEVLGPSPAPLSRVRGRYRWQILLKEHEPMRTRIRLREILTTLTLPRAVRLTVDVDPLDLL